MRRDVALSTLGWLVLRFSHRRLHDDPHGVRAEVLATLEIRRHQRAGSGAAQRRAGRLPVDGGPPGRTGTV